MRKNIQFLAAVAALMFVAILPTATRAAGSVSAEELDITYVARLGFVPIGRGEFSANYSRESYTAQMHLRSAGILRWLVRSTFDTYTEGMLVDQLPQPDYYISDFEGRGNLYQLVHIVYDGAMPTLQRADPTYDTHLSGYPVSVEQRRGSYDPLTAFISVLWGIQFSEEEPCGDSVPVFDGRRRYDLRFSYEGRGALQVSEGDKWNGEVTICSLLYDEVAGFRPTPEDDELPRPPLLIYIARFDESEFHIPVRVRATTPFGPLFLIARDVLMNSEPMLITPAEGLERLPEEQADYDPLGN